MKILAFNSREGVYSFELNNFQTDFHAHPVMEVVIATEGTFSLIAANKLSENLRFAVIAANLKHLLIAPNCTVRLLMLEHKSDWATRFLRRHDISLREEGYAIGFNNNLTLFEELMTLATGDETQNNLYDERIQRCLYYMDERAVSYHTMIAELKSEVHLSDSRLSHLFRQEIGLSLKKYLVWSRLKKTIQLVLEQGINLSSAAIRSGFYDQAHLSKAFKNMLGVSPSEAYNSRMLQE